MRMLCSVKLSPHRYKTPEGYLYCKDAIIARTGPQTYLKSEIIEGSDSDEYIDVDRRPEEVFSEKTMASFEKKPLTIDHPSVAVGPDNYRDLAVGHIENVRRGEYEGQPVMLADIIVNDSEAISLIESGEMVELSCGYDCDITTGDNPEQVNIRGNHVALCEQGRAGIARIQDSKSKEKWGIKAIADAVGKGTLIQEFGKQGKQYKISKISGNVIYAASLLTGDIVLFKKDEENIEWATITRSEVKDSKLKDKKVSFEEAVKDSYHHFMSDLGQKPSAGAILDDLVDNYNLDIDLKIELNDPVKYAKWESEVKQILNKEKLEFVDEDIEDSKEEPYCYKRYRELKALKKERPLTEQEEEDFLVCKGNIEAEIAERNQLNGLESGDKGYETFDSIDQFNVIIEGMSIPEAKEYCKTYGVRGKKSSSGIRIFGARPNIEDLLNDYIGEEKKIHRILEEGWYSTPDEIDVEKIFSIDNAPKFAIFVKKDGKWVLFGGSESGKVDEEAFLKKYEGVKIVENKDLKKIEKELNDEKPKKFVIALSGGKDGSTWLDENDKPTKVYSEARKFDSYEEADSHRKTYCRGSVQELEDSTPFEKFMEEGKLTKAHCKYVMHNVLEWDRPYSPKNRRNIKEVAKACEKYDDEYTKEEYEECIRKHHLLGYFRDSFDTIKVKEELEELLKDIPHGKISESWGSLTIEFDDKKEMKEAGKKLVKLYDIELFDNEDDELYIAIYDKYEKPHEGEKLTEDSSKGFDLKRGPASRDFRTYLKDRGLHFEQIPNGDFVHFDVEDADEAVTLKCKDIRNHYLKFEDSFSRKFYSKMIKELEDKLDKLEKNEILDQNNKEYESQKNKMKQTIKKQIEEYKAKLKDE